MVDGHPWGRMTKIQDYCTPSKVILGWFCKDLYLVRKWTYFERLLLRWWIPLTLIPHSLGSVCLALNLGFGIGLFHSKPENGKCGDLLRPAGGSQPCIQQCLQRGRMNLQPLQKYFLGPSSSQHWLVLSTVSLALLRMWLTRIRKCCRSLTSSPKSQLWARPFPVGQDGIHS